MVSSVAKILLMFAMLAIIIIAIYVIANIIIAVKCVSFIKKEGLSMVDKDNDLYFDSHGLNSFDNGTQSLAVERRRAIRAARDLHYGDECVSRLKTAKTIPEIYRILHTYRDAM